jgi:OOP family OmpA-OmpF porin
MVRLLRLALAAALLSAALAACGSIQIGVEHDGPPPAASATVAPPAVAPVATASPAPTAGAAAPVATTLPEVTAKCVAIAHGHHETAYTLCADVLFDFDGASVRPGAARALGQVARSIAKRFPGAAITIDGHSDAAGPPAYNRALSTRRAVAVKRWLVAHGGILANRIAVHGYGETRPVASNASDAGRARNRRVVVGVAAGP